ncbi:MAG: hypothetical protein R2941_19740 [Desulfobacterales bacterium]
MRFLLFFPFWLILTSCAQLPGLMLSDPSRVPEMQRQCNDLFPKKNMRLVHSIEARIPGRGIQFMTGLTLLSPGRGQFRSVMMSIEGLVIFDGVYDKEEIRIFRGIPPFDSPNFARGLLQDVRLMLLRPESQCAETGWEKQGIPICRYPGRDGMITDVEMHPDQTAIIRQYVKKSLRRTVRIRPGSQETELVFHGALGYSLYLKLLESEEITAEDFQEMMKVERQ